MAESNNKHQKVDDQDIDMNSDYMENDGYPNCEGEPCVNVTADEEDENDISADVARAEEENALKGNQADNEWKDKYMRLSAEFDNYRKRTLKEKMDLIAMGGEDVITAMLPVLDDMDRALTVMRDASDIDSVRTGIELISQKLRDMLKNKGLKEIEAIGITLDTDFHEAVSKTPAPEASKKGTIVDVAQKGYILKDKVIRHSKVVVGE